MKRIAWLLVFLCLSCQFTLAQNAQLTGVVKDKTGAAVPQAEVKLRNVDTGSALHTKTNKVGFFVFSSVESGKYDLAALATGFDETVIKGIKVDTAANVSQDLILQIQKGSEMVTVTQQAELTTEDGTVSTVIDRDLIENMPLNGKDLTTLFELSPGTVLNAGGSPESGGGFSVDGQRPTANNLMIDGVSANAYVPSTNGYSLTGAGIAISASGGTNGTLPVDALEEYRMDTSTYTAENGRTPGAQILVRTKGGTNQFHGTLFENFRNQILDATDWFVKYDGIRQSPLRMNDFGGTFGGRVFVPHLFDGANKFFFFLANDNLLLDQPNTSTEQDVPGSTLISQAYSAYRAFLAVFPTGNGGPDPSNPGFDFFSASYPYQIRDHTTSIRLDGDLPRGIHTFFRTNIAPSSSYLTGILGEGTQVNLYTYTGGITLPLRRQLLNELTINNTTTDTGFLSFTTSVGNNDPNAIKDNLPSGVTASKDTFYWELNSYDYGAYPYAAVGPSNLNSLHQWNVVDTLSLQSGNHLIKCGEDFLTKKTKVVSFSDEYSLNVNLEAAPPYTDLDTGVISQMTYYHSNGNPNVSISDASLFANDDWKITHHLTVNFGVRWEYNPAPSVGPLGTLVLNGDSLYPSTVEASISNRPLYKNRYNNLAPRFGFSFSPNGKKTSSTVIRGGVGIYFDTGQAATAAGVGASGYPYLYTQNYNEVSYSSVNWGGLYQSAAQVGGLPESAVYLVDPHLLSPRTSEWSLTLEQRFGANTKISTSYVGNDGEKLVGSELFYNAKNSGVYPVNPALVSPNGELYYLTNQSHSNYEALQVQWSSKIGEALDALVSYTWGHAEDNGSTDFSSVGASAPNHIANSANDLRNIFASAIHYAPRLPSSNRIIRKLAKDWAIDTIVRLQTASPFTVTVRNPVPNAYQGNADVIQGETVVSKEHFDQYGKTVPGGRLLNWAAFTSPQTNSQGDLLDEGNSPTNGYRLFGLRQWDVALSRTWKIWGRLDLNLRADAYNIINTANFSAPDSQWSASNASTFGRATNTYAGTYGSPPSALGASGSQLNVFQNGGPREVQLSVKLRF